MNSGILDIRSEMDGACGGLTAKRQTPNAKRQTKHCLRTPILWSLKFEVWRLALSPPQALRLSRKPPPRISAP